MSNAHAKLSPSGSTRWLECPASVTLESTVTDNEDFKVHAEVGTLAHHMGEILLKSGKTSNELFAGLHYNVDQYVEYVRALQTPTSHWHIEGRVKVFKGCWGTVDAIVYDRGHLHIIDLKYGKSPVKSEGNTQLMLYALGAIRMYPKTKKVTLHIVQPRAKNSAWEVNLEELKAFKKKAKKAGEKALDPEELNESYDSNRCFWCSAQHLCNAFNEKRSGFKDETK